MDLELIHKLIPMVLTHLVAFLLFLWLLNRFAIKPVMHLLDERREKIASSFDQIAAAEKRVASMKEDYEKRLREIDEEARKRVLEEVNRGKRIAEEIAEHARAEAITIIEKGKATIQIQMDQARVELRNEIIQLTLTATEHLLHQHLDHAKQRDLVAGFIQELEEQKALKG